MRTELIDPANAGLAIDRYIKAMCAGKSEPVAATMFAETGGMHKGWGSTPRTLALLKAAVAANTTGDAGLMSAAQGLFNEYLPLLRQRTLIDRIAGFRRVPANVSVLRFTGDVTGALVVEGAAIPVGKFSTERVTLPVRKVAAIVVLANEVLQNDEQGGAHAASELASAVGAAVDRAMFNVDVTGSVANSGTILTSAGSTLANVDSDLQLMIATFASGDAALDRAVFVMAPVTAAYLASLRGTGGARAFPDISVRSGGSLLGIPVFISNSLHDVGSPGYSSITLVDPGQVLLADPGAVEISTSQNASLQQDSVPTNNVTTPTATTIVSLFQDNCTAICGLRWTNWLLSAAAGCVTLKNVAY